MALVLLYNIPPGDKLRRIRTALLRLGLPCRQVEPAEFGHPVGYLAGLEGFGPAAPFEGEPFTTEMLVMSGLDARQFNGLLDALRASRAAVTLKAVVTENNAAWDSVALYRALADEHATMRELLAAKQKKKK